MGDLLEDLHAAPRTRWRERPAALFGLTLATIFVAEACVMALMQFLPPLEGAAEGLVDAVLLSAFAAPVLHLLVFRPVVAFARASEEGRRERAAAAEARGRILDAVRETAGHLRAASSALVESAARHTASQTEHGAAAKQIATLADSFAGSIRRAGEVAAQVADLSAKAAQMGADGRGAVDAVRDVIARSAARVAENAQQLETLADRSERIAEIVATVEEFATQTHVLALNASIEAARAGEAGRGFAVIASEVRALATSSQTATAEIARVLGDIATMLKASRAAAREERRVMGEAAQAAASAGEVIAALAEGIADAAGRMDGVRKSAADQAAAISQIAAAARAIDGSAADALESTRQVERAARELGDLAAALDRVLAAESEPAGESVPARREAPVLRTAA